MPGQDSLSYQDFEFKLQNWTEHFKVTLEGRRHFSALVSRFPECVAKLISFQLAAGQRLVAQPHLPPKEVKA